MKQTRALVFEARCILEFLVARYNLKFELKSTVLSLTLITTLEPSCCKSFLKIGIRIASIS